MAANSPYRCSRERGEVAVFADRAGAGRQLAGCLERLRGADLVVLGLPRGGVVVAAEVARALHAPLDVLVVRKLGHPAQPELAVGALGEEGVRVLSSDPRIWQRLDAEAFTAVERREAALLDQRARRLRQVHPRVDLHGRVALVVDDGIATGATMRAGCLVARALGAARVVVGVPVAAPEVARALAEADEVVCVTTPDPFQAVGLHYADFSQTTDEEVVALLSGASGAGPPTEALEVQPPRNES